MAARQRGRGRGPGPGLGAGPGAGPGAEPEGGGGGGGGGGGVGAPKASAMSLVMLRRELKQRQVNSVGNKGVLVDRLQPHFDMEEGMFDLAAQRPPAAGACTRPPLSST